MTTSCCQSVLSRCDNDHFSYDQFIRWCEENDSCFGMRDREATEKANCILFVAFQALTARNYDPSFLIVRLLAVGCNPNAQLRKCRKTALHIAIANGMRDMALQLIASKECNLEIPDYWTARTALHFAASANVSDQAVVNALTQAGANINSLTRGRCTPLHLAVRTHDAVAKQLIVAGALVDVANDCGSTPCHLANYLNLTLLIAAGADFEVVDLDGISPCQKMAFSCGIFGERFELLICAGARYETKSATSWGTLSALEIAQKSTSMWTAKSVAEMINGERGRHHRENISKARLELSAALYNDRLCPRATAICIALQCLELPALVTLALIDADSDERGWVPMYKKWNLITAVKHFSL